MKLFWSPYAIDDREAIYGWIDERDANAAIRIDELIGASCARLTNLPQLGKAGRVEGTRELVIPRTPYIVVYQLAKEDVVVLRILHGAQLWPPIVT